MDIIKLFADGFPLTIERLQFLQNTYAKAFSQLSKVAGTGNLIIDGVEITGDNVSSGVIILDGEVLEFEGGTYNDRVAIFETVNDVPYNIDDDNDGNLDLKVADVVRTARCASTGGIEPFDFSTLQRVSSLLNMMPKVGDVKMIARDFDPLVDIGWNLLPMGDTFPMGASNDVAVNTLGGENEVTLTKAELPNYSMTGSTNSGGSHSHTYKDGYFIEAYTPPQDQFSQYSSEYVGTGFRGSGDSDGDNKYIWMKDRSTNSGGSHSHSVNLNSGGSGQAHENRPKFRAFNFLIFVGF